LMSVDGNGVNVKGVQSMGKLAKMGKVVNVKVWSASNSVRLS